MSSVTATTTAPAGPAPERPRPRLDWRLRFGALSLIWGFSFLLIKVGTQGYAPFQVTFPVTGARLAPPPHPTSARDSANTHHRPISFPQRRRPRWVGQLLFVMQILEFVTPKT